MMDENSLTLKPILYKLIKVSPYQEHNDTVSDIEWIFREAGFYTTKEYPIYAMKDKSGRSGRIDLVARKGKFRLLSSTTTNIT